MAESLQAIDPTGTTPQPILGQRRTDAEREAAFRRDAEDQRLLDLARQRQRLAAEHEQLWREEGAYAQRFAAGEQWEPDQVRARADTRNPRPCLTINQVPRFKHQITNDGQQNRPGLKIRPVDSQADPHTALALDGLIRRICYDSDFDVAEDTAYDAAVTHGKGYWRLLTDYETPWSFYQVVKIERVLNPFAVYLDPQGRQHPDYHTANWGFVVERMNRDYVCEKYEIPKMQYDAWATMGDTWVEQDECTLADYYYREELPILLQQLRNREVRYVPMLTSPDEATDDERETEARLLDTLAWRMAKQGVFPLTQDEARQVEHERRSSLAVVMQCKIVGHGFAERPTVWPGQFIPIIPLLGDEIDRNGQTTYRGIVWNMMDACRSYNYWTTMAAETVSLAPKAPWIGTVEQFRGREQEWARANQTPFAYLAYNLHQENGMVAPPPRRDVQEPAIMAITQARQQAMQDLYITSTIQPADLGEASGSETSGKHAQIRKAESELGTSHYRTNRVRALRYLGRQLLDIIPPIYHEPERLLRIIGKDDQISMIQLHPDGQGPVPQPNPTGIEGVYNLGLGTYDMVVDTGPNYLTQRQEAAQGMLDAAQAIPKVAEVLPDLIVGMQDWDGAEEAARRLKKTLPPQLLDDQSQRPEDQVARLTAKLEQTTQEAQAINAHAQQLEQGVQQLGQENAQLKGDQALKAGELQLKQREMALKELEMQMKQQEGQWKREEAQLRMQVDVVKANAEVEKARLNVQTARAEAEEEGS